MHRVYFHDNSIIRFHRRENEANQSRKRNLSEKHLRNASNNNNNNNSNTATQFNIPGFTVLTDKNRSMILKVFWFCALVICTTSCFLQIQDRMAYFLSKPVHTNVEILRNETVNFPHFTICPPKPYHHPKMCEELVRFFPNYTTDFAMFNTETTNLLDFMNFTEFWEKSSYRHDSDFIPIIKCSVEITTMCSDKYSYRDISTMYGKCSTVIADRNLQFYGSNTMVSIVFLHKPRTSICFFYAADFAVPAALVYAHGHYEDPTYNIFQNALQVKRAHIGHYSITVRQYNYLDRPYISLPCLEKAAAAECRRKCAEKCVVDEAKCRLPYFEAPDLPLCNSTDLLEENLLSSIHCSTNENSGSKSCAHCPRSCEETIYSFDLQSLTRVPGNYSDNLSETRFYFRSNIFEILTEYYSYGVVSLLCDVGGNMGLFLGFSTLTLLEVFESLCNWVFTRFIRNKQKVFVA